MFAGTDRGSKFSYNLLDVGAKAGVSTLSVKKNYGKGMGTLSAQGPSVSGNIGAEANHKRVGIDAMAEASLAKAKASAGSAFAEANLNANTGAKIGTDGVKFGILGFGATLGVGGRLSLDTPLGSLGAEGKNGRCPGCRKRH